MRFLHKLPFLLTQLLLMLMLIAGVYNMNIVYHEYGWTYDVTTIIQGVEFTQTVSLTMNVFLLAFLAWLMLCIFILFHHIHTLETKENAIHGKET